MVAAGYSNQAATGYSDTADSDVAVMPLGEPVKMRFLRITVLHPYYSIRSKADRSNFFAIFVGS